MTPFLYIMTRFSYFHLVPKRRVELPAFQGHTTYPFADAPFTLQVVRPTKEILLGGRTAFQVALFR